MPEFTDPRDIWQNQPTESFRMSAHELRNRAGRRETKSRVEALWAVALGFILAFLFAWSAATAANNVTGIGWGLLSLWSLLFARQARMALWPGALAPDAPLSATVSFYRAILEKRRDFERDIWRRSGALFLILGLAIVLAPPLVQSPKSSLKALPFFVLLAVWLALYFPLRKRQRQKLQQEIDQLRAFEREHSL
jgi:uncharacterized membrane protein YfcA